MLIDEARTRIAPKLIDSLYVDAMLLADEARSYFDRHGRDDRMMLDPIVRVGFSCATASARAGSPNQTSASGTMPETIVGRVSR